MTTLPSSQPSTPPALGTEAWTDRLATWGLYAAAAGASLAVVSTAETAIISGTLSVDLKLPGSPPNYSSAALRTSFTIDGVNMSLLLAHNQRSNFANLFAPAFVSNSISGRLINFAKGAKVGGKSLSFEGSFAYASIGSNGNRGNFPLSAVGYAGLSLPNGGTGWIALEPLDRNGDGFVDEVMALSYAYNPSGPINAGQTSDAADPGTSVPEPSTLALDVFAMGAAGLLAWRRRRAQAQPGPAMH